MKLCLKIIEFLVNLYNNTMDSERIKTVCVNLLSDLYSCRNFLENGLQIKTHRKLQGAITRCLELLKLSEYKGLEKKDESVVKDNNTPSQG